MKASELVEKTLKTAPMLDYYVGSIYRLAPDTEHPELRNKLVRFLGWTISKGFKRARVELLNPEGESKEWIVSADKLRHVT